MKKPAISIPEFLPWLMLHLVDNDDDDDDDDGGGGGGDNDDFSLFNMSTKSVYVFLSIM